MLKIGIQAPEFKLPDQNGKMHSLAEARGKWTLLYFYPKDNTEGCIKQACAIRDAWPEFEKIETVVFGISVDAVKSHIKFAEKYDLPFILLSDEKKEVVNMYEVWAKKKFMGRGRASMDTARHDSAESGTLRTSFLIDPSGKIAKVYEKVKPELHAGEVLIDLKKFKNT